MLEQDVTTSGDFVLDRFFNLTEVGAFHIVDLFAGLVLATLLTLGLVQTYRSTHRGATYSVAFLQALFILSVCTTVIMIVIGSNIARAFSLVGALSIVRFRTAIKDPRDVGFVFASLAVGMASGTGFYAAAVVFTAFLCILMLVLARLNVGAVTSTDALVRVTFAPRGGDAAVASVEAALRAADASPVLVNRLHERETGQQTLAWRVRTGESVEQGRLQEALQHIDGVAAVGLYVMDDYHVL
jgi:uncharacterized membrane protein YhiD involved in acid resistance